MHCKWFCFALRLLTAQIVRDPTMPFIPSSKGLSKNIPLDTRVAQPPSAVGPRFFAKS
jgi:hypothetical protein